jgi:multidrug resistance efflux pump
MPENNDNISQDKKIDKLQYLMESIQGDIKDLKSISKETNARLEIMQKGFVPRDEHQEFKRFVGTLATQKDVDTADKALESRVRDLEDWQTWILRTIVGFVILGILSASFIINKL